MLTDHDKQATGNREPADETNKEDPTQGIPVWLQPFTVNLQDLETHVLAHSSETENSNSEGDASQVKTQKKKHSVHSYFRKNQKRSFLQTEKYGDLIKAEHKVLNEGRESRNNHRYAAVVQVLATQWNPCQTKTSQETEKNLRKFPEPSQKPKVIHTYNLLEFGKQKLGKIFWSIQRTSFIVIILNREFNFRAERRIILYFTRFTLLNEAPPRRNIRSGEGIGEKPTLLKQKQIQLY